MPAGALRGIAREWTRIGCVGFGGALSYGGGFVIVPLVAFAPP